MDSESERITLVPGQVSRGEPGAAQALLPLVYAELKAIAARRLASLPIGQTVQATALVHEAWIKLGGNENHAWESRAHYFGAAANAMRNILVDQARSKARLKRAALGQRVEVSLEWAEAEDESEVDMLELDEHLTKLGLHHERAKDVVLLRYFAGLSVNQVADALGTSPRSVDREWVFARTWLRRSMRGESGSSE